MRSHLTTFAIGFVSGVLSGAFGIGGGIVTTPAIRLILGAPALVAVGTPLPVILPSAITGAYSYLRQGFADARTGVVLGFSGALTAVLGAWLTQFAGGRLVLLATAALVLYTAVDMMLQSWVSPGPPRPPLTTATSAAEKEACADSDDMPQRASVAPAADAPALALIIAIGAVTGLYAGFLGLGGGFVLVPMLTRWARFGMKRAIGTSLFAVAILAVPGTITHALLGHIDWWIALALTLGVVPGAIVGAHISLGAAERSIKIAFAVMLVCVGVWLAVNELGVGTWLK